jgi:hypothetical protein
VARTLGVQAPGSPLAALVINVQRKENSPGKPGLFF